MYNDGVRKLPDSDLQQIFSFLNQHNIDLAVEFGPLTATTGGCGVGIEGFSGGGGNAQLLANKIKANGGVLKYIAMDEPFYFGNMYNGAGACQWSPQQIATNAATSLNVLKSEFPNLLIGDIEVVPPNGLASDWIQRYAQWMDAFQSVMGNSLAFFHADTGFTPTWMQNVVSLRVETSKRGLPLGIIYNGLISDLSDQAWTTRALQNATDYELANGQPEQAIFQSWVAYPITSLPETSPYTFTWLLDQYARQRTNLSLNSTLSQANGRLTDSVGQPVSQAPVKLSLTTTSGPGILSTFTLNGTVPALAQMALFGLRINEECEGCSGNSDEVLYSFKFIEGAQIPNEVTRNFSHGLQGWGLFTTGTVQLEQTTIDPGQALHAIAAPGQVVQLNSSSFNVTAGAPFTMQIVARVAPESIGSGYFTLIFLSGTEINRQILPLQAGSIDLGTAITDIAGFFSLPFSPQATPDGLQIQGHYAGIDYPSINANWPASASAPLLPALPTLTGILPQGGIPGSSLSVTLTGTNFSSGIIVDAGTQITVSDIAVTNSTSATAIFTIAPSAVSGTRDVTVTSDIGRSNFDYFVVQPRNGRVDLNGDGKADMVWYNTATGQSATWLMNGLASITGSSLLGPGTGWSITQFGDFNGDGKTDIVWHNTDGSSGIWLMNGAGAISGGGLLGPGTGWSVVQVGDFNGDGKSDILWQNTDGSAAIWLMNGLSVINGAGLIGSGTGWSVVQIGDFNGDGKSDILWQNTDGSAAIWLMNGLSVINGASLIGSGTGWSVVQVGDFNGDGKSDIVWQNTDGSAAIWLMNGLSVINGASLIGSGTGWSVIQVGDFNGDGKSDIVWQNTDGSAAIWLMNGLSVISGGGLIGPGTGWSVRQLGDFNGDGKSDIVWQNADGSNSIWLMSGIAAISGGGLLGPGTGWSSVPLY